MAILYLKSWLKIRYILQTIMPIISVLKFSTFLAKAVYQHFIRKNKQGTAFIPSFSQTCGKVSLTSPSKMLDICFTLNASLLSSLVF